MNIEGHTYLFYDKYCGDHGYDNSITKKMDIPDLYNGSYKVYKNQDAIRQFNKFGDHLLPTNLDTSFYDISFFVISKQNNTEEQKYLCICVNHNKLKQNIDNIPNIDFLINACSYHNSYNTKTTTNNKSINEEIKIKAAVANTDLTDPMIEQPNYYTLKLFDYQKKTIKWLDDTYKKHKKINYSFNNEIFFGDYVYDTIKKKFIPIENRKQIVFKGGLLADEMGLGKTFEMITMSLLNQAKNISYFQDNEQLLCSRATLILSPNHLSNQWIREIKKIIDPNYNIKIVSLLTKTHHNKVTYIDLLDADFIIVSYNFLGNECYYEEWFKKIDTTIKKGQTYVNSQEYNEDKIKEIITEITNDIKNNLNKLFNVNPFINCIKFKDIFIDEFHEIITLEKYNYILKLIKLLNAENKWILTGTPFDKSDLCLKEMVKFITDYKINNINHVMENEYVRDYLLNQFFRKNTKLSVKNENELIPIVEEIVKLKFTPIERAMFNAYIANSNIDKKSVLVRQLCCDPRIVNELKDELSTCKTPEDIQRTMVKHYKNAMEESAKKVRIIKYRIKKHERNIKVSEFRRYRKYLKQLGNQVIIDYPEKIFDPEFDNNPVDIVQDIDIIPVDNSEDTKETNDKIDNTKPYITINDNTIKTFIKSINDLLSKNPSTVLDNMKTYLNILKVELTKEEKIYEGKRSTSEFFTNMMQKINKIMEKKKKQEETGEELDPDDDELCSVCLNEISGDDAGVTKCGHMYCFQCIKEMIKTSPKCPQCMKPLKESDINMISFENLTEKNQTKEIKDKVSLISKIGTKLANLIFYIKNCKEKCIVFSQWDDLLKKVGDVLDTYGVKNVFCRGNVWTRDKAIRDFSTKNDIQVIMLSSESAAAGTNLTAATKVILLDPVSGTYEFRKNTEGQAIGRAHRTGQTKQVTVVRFIIKDTIEEEIYNENIIEDAKFKKDIKMTILTDDNLNLDSEEILKIANEADTNIKKKESKPKKKTTTTKKVKKELSDSDDDRLINKYHH